MVLLKTNAPLDAEKQTSFHRRANRDAYFPGRTVGPGVTRNLPTHVKAKRAKGRTYYYFSTGRRTEAGKKELLRLPDIYDPEFAEAVAAATLERWQRLPVRCSSREVVLPDAAGDHLYFAKCEFAVKIGRAQNIVNRMTNMQVSSPYLIDCICTLTGRGHEERHWHAMFADDRVRGEWFTWTPHLAKAIDDARKGKKPWEPQL